MSTDAPKQDGALRRYRIVLRSALVALLVTVAGLTTATTFQGPRVTSVQVSIDGVVERDGARLRIRLDRPIDPSASQRVVVAPPTDAEVTVVGSEITVAFSQLLRYGTEYTVTVEGATSASGTTSDLVTRFTTSSPEIFSLERGANADRIVSESLENDGSRGEFEADGIAAYATSGSTLAVVVEGEPPAIETVDRISGARGTITLPTGGIVERIRGSSSAPRIGYTVTSADEGFDSALFTLDVSDPSAEPVLVKATDGTALSIEEWLFEPGSTSIAALTTDGVLLRIDAGSDEPTVLGDHAELRGFVPGTSDLVVADPDGGTVVDLRTGEDAALELPAEEVSSSSSAPPILLDASTYLRTVTATSSGSFDVTSAVVIFDGYADRVLYAAPDGSFVTSTCLSPNGQFLAVGVAPAAVEDDAGTPARETVLVDSGTGEVERTLQGVSSDWC